MDFDLVIENLLKLNYLAGEGEHYIKQTKDGARFQVYFKLVHILLLFFNLMI